MATYNPAKQHYKWPSGQDLNRPCKSNWQLQFQIDHNTTTVYSKLAKSLTSMPLKFSCAAEVVPLGVDVLVGTVGITPTFTKKLQWLIHEKSELKPIELLTCCNWVDPPGAWCTGTGWEFFFCTLAANAALPCTRTFDTACFCCNVVCSYSCSALDRCPVTALIIFSGTFALHKAVAPVASKLWVDFGVIPASWYIPTANVLSFY